MIKQERHTLAYGVAGLLILTFFVWTFNLLFGIQNHWAESNSVTAMDKDVHALFDPWRNLNRPGNDVLENYEVAAQQQALGRHLQEYRQARGRLDMHSRSQVDLSDYYRDMDAVALEVETLARRVLDLAEERESLRLAAADPAQISAAETEAATTMAQMDQAFQSGLEIIAGMDQLLDQRLLDLDAARRVGVRSLYLIVIVALFSSALSLVLLRRTSAQGEALRSGSQRLNAIVDNVVDGVVTVDERGNVESLNRTAESMFDYSSDSVVGWNFRRLIQPESRPLYDAADFQSRSQSPGRISEATGMRSDGSAFAMELEGTRISVEGRPIIIHIVRDVTERKRSEKRLQLAATVFENTSEGIMITDRDARIQSTNPAFTAITGFAPEEVLGQNPRILQSGMQTREFYEAMWKSISDTGHWHGEIINRRKNGEDYTQWLNINSVKDGSGQVTHYVGVTFDISELKASERIKDEFIATVSHELRTPLTSIHGSLSLLDSGVPAKSPEKSADLIRIAKDNSQRLVRLIDDILSIAKIESEKMKFHLRPVNLGKLVMDAVEANQDYAQQFGVHLQLDTGVENAWVLGDKDRLMQVLTNLLSNAVKHSPEDGVIRVETVHNDAYWRVTVTDNGAGIPESFYDEVFKKFAQADATDRRKRGGTGLGLSISKAIIDRLGGRIAFESVPGVRTCFYFELPIMQPHWDVEAGAERIAASAGFAAHAD
ncbi:MAG: PAS domain S-box protein [Gammaproteobacteria bacterium]|jgi:PAS domain S-box-containing protein|nr:PAS domain S-box protein [Gammaproteobacteria bacterium]MDH3847202.1 PAS domain S-box protein [Gammaproteobacteria bacterium]MDH3863252.1 PAS domain S-box protein [Gammaproteobacteria bacterium]MDH3904814.1 PAS domain S-box protein [Gammaproteobacteria bacterium]MDH3907686.1 PAS domain S-box protein [Gammaproteobacteria bacterium]